VLHKAIQTVMAGGCWVNSERVIDREQYLRDLQRSVDERRQQTYGLTTQELEIVSAVVEGYSNREIAGHFKISEDTVKEHITRIYDKVGVSTRLELALFAVNHSVPLPGID
jgi:two-component system nitrate/nitrite response regulator NarL